MNISVHREFNLIDLLNDKSGRQNTSALVVIESNNKCTVRISNECGSGSFAFNFEKAENADIFFNELSRTINDVKLKMNAIKKLEEDK